MVPQSVGQKFDQAIELQNARELTTAEGLYREILLTRPESPIAERIHFNLGLILRSRGRVEEAADAYRQALAIEPRFPEALTNLAETLQATGRADQAIEVLRRAVELAPTLPVPVCGLAHALRDQGHLEEAITLYRRAIALEPGNTGARDGLGVALRRQGYIDQAISAHLEAIALRPGFAEAHHNLGVALAHQGRLEEARDSTRRALDLNPSATGTLATLIGQQQALCDWSNLIELEQQLLSRVVEGGPAFSPFILLNMASSPADQLICARNFAQRYEKKEERREPTSRRVPKDKIRLAYLSDHFREHPTAYLMTEVIERHDRSRFDVTAYSFGVDDGGEMRRRLRLAFDHFVDIRDLSHEEAAGRICRDDIDILVDLGGYTKDARLDILGSRPAPVQVNYLGYPGTMGARFVDYMIADHYLIPPGAERHYSEKIVRLPDAHLPYDRRKTIGDAATRAAYGLPEDGLVLCSFNQLRKVRPEMFGAWMEIMRALPTAVLWLLDDNRPAAESLRNQAQAHGVAPRRLIFAPRVDVCSHLARYRVADLALDTFPYTSHTTASDALRMGCPLTTLSGATFASRVAGSLATVAGLPELIAQTFEDYVRLVKQLALDPGKLKRLRAHLQSSARSGALFDMPRFVGHFEVALQKMWDISASAQPPRHIDIP